MFTASVIGKYVMGTERQDSVAVRNKGSEVTLSMSECQFCQLTFLPCTQFSQV